MKKCRYCKSEIDSKAKICPHCRKKQTNPILKGIMIFFGILLIVIGCSSLSNDLSSTNSDDNDNASCYLTMEKFNKIENGMSYSDVVDIIGCDGTLSTESSYEDSSMKIYYWYAKNGVANGTFSFMNDSLTAKSQIGLN